VLAGLAGMLASPPGVLARPPGVLASLAGVLASLVICPSLAPAEDLVPDPREGVLQDASQVTETVFANLLGVTCG
jgi:hypothetical protein